MSQDVTSLRTWEFDVDVMVRKTMLVTAPNADMARQMVTFALAAPSPNEMSPFMKWSDGRVAHRPAPVEKILGDAVIVEIREIPD